MPTLPGSGLLLYRCRPAADASSGGEQVIDVLLFPRGAATGTPSSGKLLEIPWWELPSSLPEPASRAGLPYEPRRREKPRLTARRTMDRLLEQARSSFNLLTGFETSPPFLPLGGVKMRGHRIVYVWGCACPPGTTPGGPGRFVPLDQARDVIEPQQRHFLEQLEVLATARGATCEAE